MRLGLLADIHECVDDLRRALELFERYGVDRVIVLGDVCAMMEPALVETCRLLRQAGAIGLGAVSAG